MKTVVLTLSVFLLAGCATMFNSPTHVTIRSHNKKRPNIVVRNAGGEHFVQMPANISLASSHRSTIIEIDDPCFEDQSHFVEREVSLTYFANILNIHGFWIDWLLGNMWTYPDNIRLAVVEKPDCKDDKMAQQDVRETYEAPVESHTMKEKIRINIKSVDYDARVRKGTIKFSGPVIHHRDLMVKKVGEICSSSNIKVKANAGVRMDGSYAINREFADDTGYGFEFECN